MRYFKKTVVMTLVVALLLGVFGFQTEAKATEFRYVLRDFQAEYVEKYHDVFERVCREEGIKCWISALAQSVVESKGGTSEYARYRNNVLGMGAWDRNPDDAKYYASVEDCVRDYCQNLKRQERYEAVVAATNPYDYVAYLAEAGYATDPEYVETIQEYVDKVAIYAASRYSDWYTDEIAEKAELEAKLVKAEGKLLELSGELSTLAQRKADLEQAAEELEWIISGHAGYSPPTAGVSRTLGEVMLETKRPYTRYGLTAGVSRFLGLAIVRAELNGNVSPGAYGPAMPLETRVASAKTAVLNQEERVRKLKRKIEALEDNLVLETLTSGVNRGRLSNGDERKELLGELYELVQSRQ